MRRTATRVAFAALIAAALWTAPAATLCASCCAAPAEAAVAAPACCGCDGAFSLPPAPERAALASRPAPLAAPAAHRPAGVDVFAWTSAPPSAALAPVRVAPSSPFPRRL